MSLTEFERCIIYRPVTHANKVNTQYQDTIVKLRKDSVIFMNIPNNIVSQSALYCMVVFFTEITRNILNQGYQQ